MSNGKDKINNEDPKQKDEEKHKENHNLKLNGKISSPFIKLTKKIVFELKKLEMKNKIKNILKEKLTTEKSELHANNIVQKVDISKLLK